MKSGYEDIRARIAEEPTWYDLHGAPRYGDIPEDVKPWTARIRCQSCAQVFTVCLVDEVYKHLYGKMVHKTYPKDESGQAIKCATCGEYKVEYVIGSMHHYGGNYAVTGDDGKAKVGEDGRIVTEWRDEVFKPLPEGWSYGDPPIHGCVGDTMGSIAEYEWPEYFDAETLATG